MNPVSTPACAHAAKVLHSRLIRLEANMTTAKIALVALALLITWSSPSEASISDACKAHRMTNYRVDDFTGRESARITSVAARGPNSAGLPLGYGFRVRLGVDGTGTVRLEMQYGTTSGDWFFISDRHPLRSLSNDSVFHHSPIPDTRQTSVDNLYGAGVQILERQWFVANPEGVKAWLSDPGTKFRIVGREGYVDRDMKRRRHRRLVEWARTCLPDEYLP